MLCFLTVASVSVKIDVLVLYSADLLLYIPSTYKKHDMPNRPNVWTSFLHVRVFFYPYISVEIFHNNVGLFGIQQILEWVSRSTPPPPHNSSLGLSLSPVPSQQAQKNTREQALYWRIMQPVRPNTIQPATQPITAVYHAAS